MTYKETLSYSNYTVSSSRPSRYDKGREVTTIDAMVCPRCRTRRPPLEHGGKATCKGCNLRMQLFGNGLTVWD